MGNIFVLSKIFKWEVDKNECWNVTSHVEELQGYIPVSFKGLRTRAHRLSYILMKGDIPKGMIVRHSCDNKSCINPEHLIMGTKKDNTQDMMNRNRESNWKDRKGHRSKLTDDQYNSIKRSDLSSYELAKIYSISDVQIRRIKNGSRGCAGSKHLQSND